MVGHPLKTFRKIFHQRRIVRTPAHIFQKYRVTFSDNSHSHPGVYNRITIPDGICIFYRLYKKKQGKTFFSGIDDI